MAKGGRRYVRDNRGRFASVGATARGGRLRTAGGNKRATVTVKATGSQKNTIAKPAGLKPGALQTKRFGEFAFARIKRAKQNEAKKMRKEREQWKTEKPLLLAKMTGAQPASVRAARTQGRMANASGALPADGLRSRGATSRGRSAVSGAVADIKAAGLPVHKPRRGTQPETPGLKVRKGWRPNSVDITAHNKAAYLKALSAATKNSEILYKNDAGLAFSIRPRRS